VKQGDGNISGAEGDPSTAFSLSKKKSLYLGNAPYRLSPCQTNLNKISYDNLGIIVADAEGMLDFVL